LRGKFDFRQTRDRQFVDHPEDRIQRAWQVSGNLNVSGRSSLKLRWYRLDERRYSDESPTSVRRSFVALTRRYEAGWNFSPDTDLRFGLQGEFITRDDQVSTVKQQEYALRSDLRHRFRKQWTVQAEVRWAEVESEEPPGAVRPWFFAFPGRNVDGTLRLAWDPTQFLGVSASWFARKPGERRWQHDVRLETTARF
jgi:hypothetical protein